MTQTKQALAEEQRITALKKRIRFSADKGKRAVGAILFDGEEIGDYIGGGVRFNWRGKHIVATIASRNVGAIKHEIAFYMDAHRGE